MNLGKYKLIFILILIVLINLPTTVYSENISNEMNYKETIPKSYSEDFIDNTTENAIDLQKSTHRIELYYLFIGSFLSLSGSLVFALLTRLSNKLGSFKIYTKVVYAKTDSSTTMQIKDNSFHIPIWVEFINTKNETIIIRDFNIAIYDNNNFINKMTQINAIGSNSKKIILANDGNYTFVVPPRSTKKYDLHFTLKYEMCPENFNNVKVIYYNDRDKLNTINFKNFPDGWNSNVPIKDDNWNKLI